MSVKAITPEAMRLLHEGAITLSRIEAAGVRVNTDYLTATTKKTEDTIKELTTKLTQDEVYRVWRRRYGDKTKLGSREQLAAVVFGDLGYEVKGITATGRAAANKDALDDIDIPFVENYLRVENLKKTLGTYLYGIKTEMVQHGGHWFVHPVYNLHTVSTFRSSSNSPNFQNYPKRNPEMAELIRPCFLPHPGHHMVEIDFGQIEVRVAECYTKDPVLKKYILDPTTDMHRDSAMQLFCLKKEEVWKKTTRDSAKNQWVFPQFYGSVYFNCARNIWKAIKQRNFRVGENGIGIYEHLAKKGIKERGACEHGQEPVPGTFEFHCKKIERDFWHNRFKVYTKWKRSWYDSYQRTGGFMMHTGFAVNIIMSRTEVCNFPIQGSAFHCLLWSLIELDKWLHKYKMRSKIVGEIHDSMLLSVHPKELQDVLTKAKEIMTVSLLKHWSWINVPLEIESDVAPVDAHWMQCKLYTEKNGTWGVAG